MSNVYYDLVVVGTGNAALSAAISANENGARVLMVEKAKKDERGGNSYFTDGAIRFAYTDQAGYESVVSDIKQGDVLELPKYDTNDFYDDMMKVTKGQSKPELARLLVNRSFDTVQWMKGHGVSFIMNENQYFEKDGVKTFWGGLPTKTDNKGIGLVEALFKKANELGVDIWYDSPAIEILKEQDKISGIVVKKQGVMTTIQAKAVILACGGFEANKEKRIEHLGSEWSDPVVRGTKHNTGDGISMALQVGAVKAGQYDGCHAHTTDYNAPRVGDFSKPGDIYKKSSYPLGLIVNIEGQRFVDEGADFRNYTYAKYGKETLKQTDHKAFQLYDSQVKPLLRIEYELDEATKIEANDLEMLSEKMGVDKEQFIKTIESYNDAVLDGAYDPSIKDGKKTSGITPPKSNWALKFNKPPYYAYPVTCGITFTFGGVKVNDKTEVLNHENEPIKGLYAAGEMVGELFYHNYPGGSGLMSGSVFGRTAGESAAQYISL